jgi:hypothetical protein
MSQASGKIGGDARSGSFRLVALAALVTGVVVFPLLTFYSGRHSDEWLVVTLMAIWVSAPFAALLAAHRRSRRWLVPTRATLDILSVCVTVFSLFAFANAAFGSRRERPAPVLVMVPLVVWLLAATIVPAAAALARRQKAEGDANRHMGRDH